LDPQTDLKTLVDYYENHLWALNIPSGQKLLNELRIQGGAWDLCRLATRLLDRPLLLIGAGRDMDAPAEHHHLPLVRALQRAGAGKLTHDVLDSDHHFSNRRTLLARTLLSWLRVWFQW
jgi:hypothetical protein